MRGIALVSAVDVGTWALTGVFARGSGINQDRRRDEPYEIYSSLKFKIPVGQKGDCYDRYIIRIEEMRQSVSIILQTLNLMPRGLFRSEFFNSVITGSRFTMKKSMEAVIRHFKNTTTGFTIAPNEAYVGAETPKGELGVFVASDGTSTPYRAKIRPSGIAHLQGLDFMTKDHFLADVVTTIGTQDIVFGEVDR